MGTKAVREAMDETDAPVAVAGMELGGPDEEFMKQRSECLLYG